MQCIDHAYIIGNKLLDDLGSILGNGWALKMSRIVLFPKSEGTVIIEQTRGGNVKLGWLCPKKKGSALHLVAGTLKWQLMGHYAAMDDSQQ